MYMSFNCDDDQFHQYQQRFLISRVVVYHFRSNNIFFEYGNVLRTNTNVGKND